MAKLNSTITLEISAEAEKFLKRLEDIANKLSILLEKVLIEIQKEELKQK